jgi:hypothetical protein
MKLNTLIGSGMLILALGMVTPTYAQEQHDQDHPTKPEEGKPEDKPKQQAEPPKTPNDQPRSTEREAKPPEEKQARPEKQEAPAPARQAQQNEHKQTAQQHGRIPDDKYKANFGKEHRFHIGHPTVVEGRPRFEYGGYSFFISEAWPTGWSYDDYVYIVEINGVYYLVDDAHSGVQLALVIE